MGEIRWTLLGPFEIHPWGGMSRVPLTDPRVKNDPRAHKLLLEAEKQSDATEGTDTERIDDDSDDVNMDRETGKRSADQAGLTSDSDTKRTSMDRPIGDNQLALRAGGAPSPGGGGPQETAVSNYNRIEGNIFGETRTVSLPWVGYFSMNVLDKSSPVVLKINMNDPYQILTGNSLTAQTINTTKTKGLSNCCSKEISSTNFTSLTTDNNFPCTVIGPTAKTATVTSSGTLTDASAVPARRPIYDRLYESHHTIETKWTVTVEYSTNEPNGGGIMFMDWDAYTASSTGNVIPTDQRLIHYLKWPRVNTHRFGVRYLQNDGENSFKKSFSGVWRPGQVLKNTANDEDIKTWYPNAAPSPQWVESLVLLGMADEYSQSHGEGNFNVKVELEFIVQYKDLKRFARYPQIGDSTTNVIQFPADTFQTPSTVETVP